MPEKTFIQHYGVKQEIQRNVRIQIDDDWTSNQVAITVECMSSLLDIVLDSTEQVEYVRDQLTAILTEWKRLNDGLNEVVEISQKAGLYE